MPPAILEALEPAADAAAAEETVRVVRAGTCTPWPEHGELLLEVGRAVRLAGHLPADLPLGYHDFFPDRGQRPTRVIVSAGPSACAARGGNGAGRATLFRPVGGKLGHRRPGRPAAAGRLGGRPEGRSAHAQSPRRSGAVDSPGRQPSRWKPSAFPARSLAPLRIGLGTWAIGGWMWGGTDEAKSIRTIHAALDHGITLIDTASAYGFGRSEEIVGKALAEGGRRGRCGSRHQGRAQLEERAGRFATASRARIMKEMDDSLQVGCVPTPSISTRFTGRTRKRQSKKPLAPWRELLKAGKIRAIGVGDFSPAQMEAGWVSA